MHPLGMYLVIKDVQREQWSTAPDDRRTVFARVDASPIVAEEPASRIGRLAAILRRRSARTAGA
jgi:hypothetical protein